MSIVFGPDGMPIVHNTKPSIADDSDSEEPPPPPSNDTSVRESTSEAPPPPAPDSSDDDSLPEVDIAEDIKSQISPESEKDPLKNEKPENDLKDSDENEPKAIVADEAQVMELNLDDSEWEETGAAPSRARKDEEVVPPTPRDVVEKEEKPVAIKGGIKTLPAKEVTKGEKQFVEQMLASSGDTPVYINWVSKYNNKNEVQARLLVVGHYRIYTIKRRWNGKKELRRDGHLADLNEIVSDNVDHVVLKFTRDYMKEPFIIDVRGEGVGIGIAMHVAASLDRWAFDMPSDKLPKITLERPTLNNDITVITAPKPPVDTQGGFLAMYTAMCQYYSQPVSPQVVKFVETLGSKRTTFWLNRCSQIRKANVIPLRPIVSALKYNQHFVTIMLTNSKRQGLIGAFAAAVVSHNTVRRMVLSRCAGRAQDAIALGRSLTRAEGCLSHIDLSLNAIGDRGALGLVAGLRSMKRPLRVLRLAGCGLTHKSLAPLFFAFTDVGLGVITSATYEIDISDNAGGPITTNAVINWLRVGALQDDEDVEAVASGGKRHTPRVRRLLFDACKLEMARLLEALRTAPALVELEMLSVGGTKLTPDAVNSLKQLIENGPRLNIIGASACQLDALHCKALCAGIGSRNQAKPGSIEVDFSGNDIGALGITHIVSMLNTSECVGSLNIRDTKLPLDALVPLFNGLASSECLGRLELDELIMSFDTVKKPSQSATPKVQQVLDTIITFLGTPGIALSKLVFFGQPDSYYLGKMMYPFIASLAAAPLTYIDVSGQMLEDKGAVVLGELIVKTKSLQTLVIDDNHITHVGFESIRAALDAPAYTLCNLPYPRNDIRRVCSNGQKSTRRINIILGQIKDLLKRNRKREENLKVTWVGEDDDSDSEDGMSLDDVSDAPEPANADVLGQTTLRGRGRTQMAFANE